MRRNILIASLFVIAMCAVVSTAQSGPGQLAAPQLQPVILVDGEDGGPMVKAEVFRNVNGSWTLISSRLATRPIALAGDTVRLKISGGGQGPILSEGVHTFRAPCAGGISVAGAGGGAGTGVLTLTGSGGAMRYNWQTSTSWKATCRMLVMKFPDGNHYGTRVRFN